MNQVAVEKIEQEIEDKITNLLHFAKNMGAYLKEGVGPKQLRMVETEKGYAHFYNVLDTQNPNGVQVENAFAVAGTIGHWHVHDVLEVICVYEGSVRFQQENGPDIYLDKNNPVAMFPKGVKHKPFFDEECHAICVMIPADPKLKVG
jgi:quercetin dioxygenase-like cupin family protein